jgi:hypothetical protein
MSDTMMSIPLMRGFMNTKLRFMNIKLRFHKSITSLPNLSGPMI